MQKELTQKEFITLFPNTRFRYIHDSVKGSAIQGSDILDLLWNKKGYGIFYTVNGFPPTGKADQSQLLSLNGNYVDFDVDANLPQEEKEKLIDEAIMFSREADLMPPTIINRTQKGVHLIWLFLKPLKPTLENIEKWKDVQKRLVHCFSGDKNAIDPSRVLRLPYTLHLKDPNNPFEIKIVSYKPGARCTLEELDMLVPKYSYNEVNIKTPAMELLLQGVPIGKGLRHGALSQIAGLLLKGVDTAEKVEIARMNYYNWDQKITGSKEGFEERKKELDDTFEGILKLNVKNRETEIKKESNIKQCNTLLSEIPKDTPKELILKTLKPLLETLASSVNQEEGEIYIRNKVKNELDIKTTDIASIIKHFKEMKLAFKVKSEIEKKKAEQVESEPPMTEEEKQNAENILKSPTLLFNVLTMVKKLGVVGEEKNILLHYIIFTSRNLKQPLSATVKGDSSSGKSYTLLTTIKLFPKSAYIDLTDATPQSFFYCPEDHFKNKIIVIFEKHGSERADYAIRTLQSEGKLKIQVTVKNPETGQFEAQIIEKEGPTGFVTTTTASFIHSENDTRNISMFPDQSSEQTSRVYASVDSRYLGIQPISEKELKPWHHAQLLLEKFSVHIPFVKSFRKYFPNHIVRTRRDYGHFLAIIETVAFLHQKQREVIELNGQKYIKATLADAYMAKVIVENSLSKSIYELPDKSIEVIKTAQVLIEKKKQDPFDNRSEEKKAIFTISELAKKLGWDRDTVAKWLKPASKKGYVTIVTDAKGPKGTEYKLEEKELPGDTFLPSVSELIADNSEEKIGHIYNPLTGETITAEMISTDAPIDSEGVKNTCEKNSSIKAVGASVQEVDKENKSQKRIFDSELDELVYDMKEIPKKDKDGIDIPPEDITSF